MESVYIFVEEAPENLKDNEMYIPPLPFEDVVRACDRQRGGMGATVKANYLRAVAAEVGRRYDKTFNHFKHVVPSDYDGTPTASDADTAKVVKTMFEATYPQIYDKYIETLVKDRPLSINTVFLGIRPTNDRVLDKLGLRKSSIEELGGFLKQNPLEELIRTTEKLDLYEEVDVPQELLDFVAEIPEDPPAAAVESEIKEKPKKQKKTKSKTDVV